MVRIVDFVLTFFFSGVPLFFEKLACYCVVVSVTARVWPFSECFRPGVV